MFTKYLSIAAITTVVWLSAVMPISAKDKPTDSDDPQYVAIDEFSFSLALGIGERTNPLVGGDDIPLYLIPSLNYYGERFFFDNGDLGYSFYNQDTVVVSALARLNPENAHFSRWHPKNIAVFSSFVEHGISTSLPDGVTSSDSDSETNTIKLDIDEVAKRKWAVDAGIQVNWFINESWSFSGQLLHDINSVYNGLNSKVELSYQPQITWSERISVQTSFGVDWSSSAMANYYYGINERDTINQQAFYQTSSATNPYAKLHISYKLNAHWQLFLAYNYTSLDSSLYRSPLVEEKNITTRFIGVNYVF